MDFDLGFPSLGGAHVYRFEPESGDRLRYIKTAAQATTKWTNSTNAGTDTWATNLNNTTKPIVQAAIDARGKMQANWNNATAPGGVWERRLQAVGDGGVKSAAQAKKANYGTGVSQAAPKFNAAITKILAYEQNALSQLTPKSSAGSGRTRMNEWFDLMSAARGTLGAT